uniref:BPTI/Kunitz inhibitor domain-containing protein n=1 Tax=Parastrongyloides trichosuri TaxID=131310 RepID=A0A0N5A6Y8_PARTI
MTGAKLCTVFSFETAVKIEHKCEARGKGKLSSKSRICYFYPGDVNSHCKRNCASNLYEPTVDLTSPATGAKQICWKEGESGFPVPLLYEN